MAEATSHLCPRQIQILCKMCTISTMLISKQKQVLILITPSDRKITLIKHDKKLDNGEMGKVNLTHGVREPPLLQGFKTVPNVMHILKHYVGQTRLNNE